MRICIASLRQSAILFAITAFLGLGFAALPASATDVTGDAAKDAPKTFDFDAVLTTDIMANLHGGLKTGTLAMSNLDLTAAWQGPDGWEAFGYIEVTNNDGFSDKYVGDQQYVSNIDLPQGIHLSEAWVRKTSTGQHFATSAGFINVNDQFDVQDVAALFVNSSHGIGIEFGQAGTSGKPIAALGVIQSWIPHDDLSFRLGLFDAVGGDPDHFGSFTAAYFSKETGLQYQMEAEKDFDGGYVKLGHWGNTVRTDPLDGVGPAKHNAGTYGMLSLTLTQEQGDKDQGLKGWLRCGAAAAHALAFDRYTGAGLVYTGPIKGRDHDQFGFAIASGHFGRPYRATVEDRVSAETSYELTYQYEVKPGFVLQPDLQYIQHPSGSHSLRDAIVVGLQIRIGLDAI